MGKLPDGYRLIHSEKEADELIQEIRDSPPSYRFTGKKYPSELKGKEKISREKQ